MIESEMKQEIAQLGDEAEGPERAAIRLRVRLERVAHVLDQSRTWLEAQRPDVVPKGPLGTEVGHEQNNWAALAEYVGSGELDNVNHVSEREMKAIAIGRRTWLFTASEASGRTAEMLFSMVASCRRHGHESFA